MSRIFIHCAKPPFTNLCLPPERPQETPRLPSLINKPRDRPLARTPAPHPDLSHQEPRLDLDSRCTTYRRSRKPMPGNATERVPHGDSSPGLASIIIPDLPTESRKRRKRLTAPECDRVFTAVLTLTDQTGLQEFLQVKEEITPAKTGDPGKVRE